VPPAVITAVWEPVADKCPFERCRTGEEIVTDEEPGKDKEGELLVRLRQKDDKKTAKGRQKDGKKTAKRRERKNTSP
jgi:hypothetical protein